MNEAVEMEMLGAGSWEVLMALYLIYHVILYIILFCVKLCHEYLRTFAVCFNQLQQLVHKLTHFIYTKHMDSYLCGLWDY